jgi:integrase
MGRAAEGWRLVWRRGVGHVRFRHDKHRYDVSTRTRDPRAAADAAASIYADIIGGRAKQVTPGRVVTSLVAIEDVLAKWLCAIEATHAKNTVGLYTLYAKTHWIPFFGRFDRITPTSAAEYGRARLRKVTRDTVKKELAALRNFLAWCQEQGVLGEAPKVATLPRRAMGVRSANRKTEATDLTPEDVDAFIAVLPEWSSERATRFAVRARFRVAWETALRPSTLDRLSAPEHYRAGASELVVADDIDKARFGRTLPLTDAARRALDSVVGKAGLVFGKHDYRPYIRAAATRAGLDPAKVATLTPYDMRHARTLHLTETSGNLPGVAFLVGHTRITTTDKYLRATRRAANRVLESTGNGWHSGDAATAPPDAKGPGPEENPSHIKRVRRRGLEPLRLSALAPQGGGLELSARDDTRAGDQDGAQNGTDWTVSGGGHPTLARCRAELDALSIGWDLLEEAVPS